MASWIVHLRIAELLLGEIRGLDEAAFAVGNIAPDSGVPDEKWETFTPPPEVSHFQNPAAKTRRCADLAFYRTHLRPLNRTRGDPKRFSFNLGYYVHLVTDNLWFIKVGHPTLQKFQEEFAAHKDFIWEVKRDWYGLDFEYVRSQPNSLFWRVFISASHANEYLDFMPAGAIQQRLEYIKAFYQRTDEEVEKWYIQHPGVYLSQAEMDAFVMKSAELINRACSFLSGDTGELDGCDTILEVLEG